jgi:hypothetical protein
MDDVDAVQAQIAKTMLTSGDWVTARLDGVLYLEKAPLIYWIIAIFYKVLGATDWVARLPVALSSIVSRCSPQPSACGHLESARDFMPGSASAPAWDCSSSRAFRFPT